VQLEGDWGGLLSQLPGWRRNADGVWTGSGADLLDQRHPGQMLLEIGLDAPGGNLATVICIHPNSVDVREGSRASRLERSPHEKEAPRLNHVALDLDAHDPSVIDSIKRSEIAIFLPRLGRFDPSVQEVIEAEHIVAGKGLYLTARFFSDRQPRSLINHVGWQCPKRGHVDDIHASLQRLGWPIVFGPGVVDGSYLVHFRGPDSRVHDMFFVLPDEKNA
jgi:hypothetical protein